MKFATLTITIALLFSLPAFAQQQGQHYLKEIGWTITLPQNYKVLSAEEDAAINAKGQKAIEATYDSKIDVSATKTLISARKNQFNFFNCTVTNFDAKRENWLETEQALKDVLFNTFKTQLPKAKIDTSSVKVKVDGIDFNRFCIIIGLTAEKHLTCYLYSKLYKGYDLGITCMYLDEETGKELQTILDGSKFDK